MLFPSICDVIRNLSGMLKLIRPDVFSHYFDVPQNYDEEIGGEFYINELNHLRNELGKLSGREISDDALRNSIVSYNENRQLVRKFYTLRAEQPWKVPATDAYLLMRASMLVPVEEHSQMLKDYMALVEKADVPQRDNCKIVVNGMFCEQPPLSLIKSLELAGCYVVDDDFMMINRWPTVDIPIEGDPIKNLSSSFLKYSLKTSATFEPNEEEKGKYLVEAGIPFTAFKYAENSGQMQPIREQAGTFADSIKLWGDQL
jgi:benzoyl-CoA reductase subunit C